VRDIYRALGATAGISILAACTSGQSGIEPPVTSVNPQTSTVLQFRVGTARYPNGSVYLNTVTTYRQTNGLSGTLYNTPTITGPAGFLVPAAASIASTSFYQNPPPPNTDDGKNHISGTPPTQPGTTAVETTFNQSGGVFSYGFAPANSTTSGAANYVQFSAAGANNALYADDVSTIIVNPVTPGSIGNSATNIETPAYGAPDVGSIANDYTQPIYVAPQNRLPFLLGPPAVPDFHNGTFPSGFLGYDSGFTMFGITPVGGTYSLTINIPSATIGALAASFTQTATLTALGGLPAEPNPTITATGTVAASDGGATFTVGAAPAGVTSQVLYVVDINANSTAPTMYAFNAGTAGGTFTLSATSGPKNAGGVASAPFAVGDSVDAYVVGADFDIVGGAPPANTQQSPTLPAQTDVTVSPVYEGVYSAGAGPLGSRRARK
jgi:hypothetical protein